MTQINKKLIKQYFKNITNNSTEDGYCCDYINKALQGTILYDGATGTTGNITLSDSVSNYTRIDIVFRYQNHYKTLSCYGSGLYMLNSAQVNSDGRVWEGFKNITLSGTTITIGYIRQVIYENGRTIVSEASDQTYITKVIGYK